VRFSRVVVPAMADNSHCHPIILLFAILPLTLSDRNSSSRVPTCRGVAIHPIWFSLIPHGLPHRTAPRNDGGGGTILVDMTLPKSRHATGIEKTQEYMMKAENIGSNFDDFLQEEGLLDEANAVAIKRVIAWQDRSGDESAEAYEVSDGKKNAHQPRRAEPFAR